jgi:hypothetical protein
MLCKVKPKKRILQIFLLAYENINILSRFLYETLPYIFAVSLI